MDKIDFVLPWVDGNDKDWQEEKNRYNPKKDNDSNSSARYRDMGTLKYVLRSIEQNAPWYNKIYLITTGHYPEWLDISHPKIELVTHDKLYFDKSHLPTFSSSSIEMNLPNLKGLSDKFVYLNDDMIIMRSVEPTRFFRNGLPVDFFSHGWLPRNSLFKKLRGMDAWVHSLNNNLKLINSIEHKLNKNQLYHKSYPLKTKISNFLYKNIYKKIIWLEHWHHPQPYLKKTLLEVYDKFGDEMMVCSANRFRANNDLTQYLYRYWRLVKGEFVPYMYRDGFDADIVSFDYLKSALEEIPSYSFVCFNDQMMDASDEEFEKTKETLMIYLENKFSKMASFEKEEN